MEFWLLFCASWCVRRRPSRTTLLSVALCLVSHAIKLALQRGHMQMMRFHHICCFDLVLTWPSSHRGLHSHKHTQTIWGYSWHASLWQRPPVCWWPCWCWQPVKRRGGRAKERIGEHKSVTENRKNLKCQVFHFKTWHPSTLQKVAFSFLNPPKKGRQQSF